MISFNRVLYGTTLASQKADAEYDARINHSLCLTVVDSELLHAIQQASILVNIVYQIANS